MNIKFENEVDEIGFKILKELQSNARVSFTEIGRRVGLSSPAVAERVHKLQEVGIINGYYADVIPAVYNHNITAFITITTQSKMYPKVFAFANESKEIIECHHLSGNESLILKTVSSSINHLENLVEKLSKFGETKTSIVLSTPIRKTILEPIQ